MHVQTEPFICILEEGAALRAIIGDLAFVDTKVKLGLGLCLWFIQVVFCFNKYCGQYCNIGRVFNSVILNKQHVDGLRVIPFQIT